MMSRPKEKISSFTLVAPCRGTGCVPQICGTDIGMNTRVKLLRSFTLVELLIVIAILAVLAAAVVLVINPAELLAQSRDSERMTDFQALKKSIDLYMVDFPGGSLGTLQTIYISLPDADPSCSSHILPPLPVGWQYHCSPAADLLKMDGSGWMPIDFSSMPSGAPLSHLVSDPVNTAADNHFYSYIADDAYEINTTLESSKFSLAGNDDKVSNDGGDEPNRYEIGSDITMSPWTMDFKNFLTTTVKNGSLGWYKNAGSGAVTTGSDAYAENYGRAAGTVWYEWQDNIPFNPNFTYKTTCRVRQVADPTVGGKSIYCGLAGVASNKTTYVNKDGSNSYSSQHYHTWNYSSLTVDPNFTERTGYTKGFGSPTGTDSGCSNPSTPCPMHQNVRFIRPLFLLNYSGGDGIADIDSFTISKY